MGSDLKAAARDLADAFTDRSLTAFDRLGAISEVLRALDDGWMESFLEAAGIDGPAVVEDEQGRRYLRIPSEDEVPEWRSPH